MIKMMRVMMSLSFTLKLLSPFLRGWRLFTRMSDGVWMLTCLQTHCGHLSPPPSSHLHEGEDEQDGALMVMRGCFDNCGH